MLRCCSPVRVHTQNPATLRTSASKGPPLSICFGVPYCLTLTSHIAWCAAPPCLPTLVFSRDVHVSTLAWSPIPPLFLPVFPPSSHGVCREASKKSQLEVGDVTAFSQALRHFFAATNTPTHPLQDGESVRRQTNSRFMTWSSW